MNQIVTPLLVLDLDGTVRHGKDELGYFGKGAADVIVFPEVIPKMRAWRAKGGRIIGCTNQGGVALGHLTYNEMAAGIVETQRQCEGLFDKIAACCHHPDATDPEFARCWCRKPSPGLLIESALELASRYNEMYPPYLGLFVGDMETDRKCAELAGFPFAWAWDWRCA